MQNWAVVVYSLHTDGGPTAGRVFATSITAVSGKHLYMRDGIIIWNPGSSCEDMG